MATEQSVTRDRILVVARECFARNGFDGTSVREITSRAGANIGAITYHFGSKEALYAAVLTSLIHPLRDRVTAAATVPGPPLDRIEATVRAIFAHLDEHVEQAGVMMHELVLARELHPMAREWVGFILPLLSGLVAEGQADGSVRAMDPLLAAVSILAQPFFFAMTRERGREVMEHLGGAVPDAAALAEHACRFIRRSLEAPRRPA
jgi:AcrR family transcriptional regulator